MKKVMKRLLKYLSLTIILFLPIGYISSFNAGSIESFPGLGHDYMGCHDDTISLSSGGVVNLTLKEECEIEGGNIFVIIATIKGFSEAAGELVVLGFSSGRGHNEDFEFDPGYNGAVLVNSSGDATGEEFSVTAPSQGGEYTITADALSGGDGYVTLNWTYGTLEITVIPATTAGGIDVVLTVILGTIASVGTLVVVSGLTIKYVIGRRRLIQDA